jgi:hypothetical protein
MYFPLLDVNKTVSLPPSPNVPGLEGREPKQVAITHNCVALLLEVRLVPYAVCCVCRMLYIYIYIYVCVCVVCACLVPVASQYQHLSACQDGSVTRIKYRIVPEHVDTPADGRPVPAAPEPVRRASRQTAPDPRGDFPREAYMPADMAASLRDARRRVRCIAEAALVVLAVSARPWTLSALLLDSVVSVAWTQSFQQQRGI